MFSKYRVYYEMATPPEPGKAASIMVPRVVNTNGEDVEGVGEPLNMDQALRAVNMVLCHRFNQGPRGHGSDRITIQEVFD